MKKAITFLFCMVLFISCQQSKEGIVKDLIEAENNVNTEKMRQLLADSFMFYGARDTLNKEAFMAKLEYYKPYGSHKMILNIYDLDSIVKTEEQLLTIVEKYLEVTPLIVQKRIYRFADNKVKTITVDSTLNHEECIKSFNEKWTPFALWVKDKYDVEEETEIMENIKEYLSEYSNLPASDKKQ